LFGPKDPFKKTTLPSLCSDAEILERDIDFEFDVKRNSSVHSYLTRKSNDLYLPPVRTNWGQQTFIYQASKD